MNTAASAEPVPAADVLALIGQARLVPVVTVDDVDDAVPIAAALRDGGLPILEITLRTSAAIEAIRRVDAALPDVTVGAGSVMSGRDADAAIDAGARFVVSPGLARDAVETADGRRITAIPGIATPTELLQATGLGADVVKVFPAEVVGGPALITALAAVWPQVRFVPTGGISPANVGDYLALAPVLAVGGSWMVDRAMIAAGDWAAITRATAAAVETVGRAT
jgi:2-dehydro-3-deoxyphosphogluconate aldolase/(4S)-4-hydroxy-2-oxoglutarate aldolase